LHIKEKNLQVEHIIKNYQRMWEGKYSLTYCELKARVYTYTPYVIGGEYKNYIYISKEGLLQAYACLEEMEHLKKFRYTLLMNPEIARNILKESREICKEQDSFTDKLIKITPHKLSNTALAKLYSHYMILQQRNQVFFTVSQPEMLAFLERDLEVFIRNVTNNDEEFLNNLFLFTVPTRTSKLVEEDIAWRKIVIKVAQRKEAIHASKKSTKSFEEWLINQMPDIVENIDYHLNKFQWLPTQEFNEPWDRSYKLCLLQEALKTPIKNLKKQKNMMENRFTLIQAEREELFRLLLPPPPILYQALLLRELAALRWDLRLTRTRADYVAREMRRVIADRIGINHYQLEYLLLNEIYDFLLHDVPIDMQELEKRLNFYVWQLQDGVSKLFTGEKAYDIYNKYISLQENISLSRVLGKTANCGYVKGPVKVIATGGTPLVEEIKKMDNGDILVTGQTRPQLIDACQKAGAIVTDEGGIASHAAVISRELGVPCIVGTYNGTKVLKNHDQVEVDATQYHGVIKILRPVRTGRRTHLNNNTLIKTFMEIKEKDLHLVGGKALPLAKLIRLGFCVPWGFVITTEGIKKGINTIKNDIMQAVQMLETSLVVIRSSAVCEDSQKTSFAGQFESFTNVNNQDIFNFIHRCIESSRSHKIVSYCEKFNLNPAKIEMAVIIQEMIQNDLSGVCFTTHPIENDSDKIHISACYGLGEMLVSGKVTPDEYIVNRQDLTIVKKQISKQRFKLECRGGENISVEINSELQNIQKVDDETILEIANVSLDIADKLNYPVEIEWGIQSNKLYIFQARPITTK